MILSAVVPLICAVLALRHRQGWIAAVMAAGFVAIGVWSIWKGRQMQGWDGIGYAILTFLICAPAVLGTGVGAGIGWWQRRKRRQ